MEESERGMKSRFAKPHYRFVALDDMDMELVRACKRAQRLKSRTCVVIGVRDVERIPIPNCKLVHEACSITAAIVWGKEGERLSAAFIKAMTLMNPTEDDTEDIALEFAADLVDFLDSYDSDISSTMSKYFIAEIAD